MAWFSLDAFAFLKFAPLAQPPMQSYSASERLARGGEWCLVRELRCTAAEDSPWEFVWKEFCRKEIYSPSNATETSLECECKCSG